MAPYPLSAAMGKEMIVYKKSDELKTALAEDRANGRTIGLVPSMGALHEGHLTLARRSLASCQRTVFVIFVNPKQFGPDEDFDAYPRDLAGDMVLLAKEGVDYCFSPSVDEIWPEGNETFVDTTHLSHILLGKIRPALFRGIATVVAKIFNIVGPDKAFFGEKDFQQLAIIRRMVRDLAFPVEIVAVPTLREPDGLASSSRNLLLSLEDRKAAVIMPRSWQAAESLFQAGERSAVRLVGAVRAELGKEPRGMVEAVDLRDAETLAEVPDRLTRPAVLLLTVRFGDVRLIDQHVLGSGEMKKDAGAVIRHDNAAHSA